MKNSKKSLLKLEKSTISKLSSIMVAAKGGEGNGGGVGKTDLKSKLRVCISLIQQGICK